MEQVAAKLKTESDRLKACKEAVKFLVNEEWSSPSAVAHETKSQLVELLLEAIG